MTARLLWVQFCTSVPLDTYSQVDTCVGYNSISLCDWKAITSPDIATIHLFACRMLWIKIMLAYIYSSDLNIRICFGHHCTYISSSCCKNNGRIIIYPFIQVSIIRGSSIVTNAWKVVSVESTYTWNSNILWRMAFKYCLTILNPSLEIWMKPK